MKRKDIEKAAGDYSGSSLGFTDNNSVMAKHKAFVDGAEWRINIVWHDVKEMPENNRMILIIMQHDIPTVLGPDNTFFKEEVKDRQIHRWAYVEDLKPNMED